MPNTTEKHGKRKGFGQKKEREENTRRMPFNFILIVEVDEK